MTCLRSGYERMQKMVESERRQRASMGFTAIVKGPIRWVVNTRYAKAKENGNAHADS